MSIFVQIGIVVTLLGLAGILWSLFAVMKVRRQDLDDDVMKARLEKIMPVNLGALFLSMLGLILVVTGLFLR